MKAQGIIVVAASAAFFLAGAVTANDSEAINVALPSQYRMVWDQTPYAVMPGLDSAAYERTAPLRIRVPDLGSPSNDRVEGPYARNIRKRTSDRG